MPRTKGAKDKSPRRRAGMVAGAVGGAGALAAGVRYGGAEVGYQMAKRNRNAKRVLQGGAGAQLKRDYAGVKAAGAGAVAAAKTPRKTASTMYQGAKSRLGRTAKSVRQDFGRAVRGATTPTGVGGVNKGLIPEAATRARNVLRTGTGKAGAAAVAGGAGYGIYRMIRKRQKNR